MWSSLTVWCGHTHDGLLSCRRINVSDVKEEVFRLFLSYLYGDSLSTVNMALATLAELMTMADRWPSPDTLVGTTHIH